MGATAGGVCGVALAATWLALLAGCSVPPYPGTPQAAAQAAKKPATAQQPASGRSTAETSAQPVSDADVPVPGVMPALNDSGPSPAAREVLNSIPEVVSEAEGTPRDSASDHDETTLPIPSETRPLGDRDLVDSASTTPAAPSGGTPDSMATAPGSGASGTPVQVPEQRAPAAPPSNATPAKGTPSAPGTASDSTSGSTTGSAPASGPCWRVQFGAPESVEEAEGVRAAAASQLVIGITVEQDGKYYKIRSADCFDREGAVKLRDRATASGFNGAFLLRGNTR